MDFLSTVELEAEPLLRMNSMGVMNWLMLSLTVGQGRGSYVSAVIAINGIDCLCASFPDSDVNFKNKRPELKKKL